MNSPLGQWLVDHGILSQTDWDEAESLRKGGDSWPEVLEQLNVRDDDVVAALSQASGLPIVELAEQEVDTSLLTGFPQKLIYRRFVFPLAQQNGSLTVATSDPFDWYTLDQVSAATGKIVQPVLASRAEIAKLIKHHLGVGGETVDGLIARSDDGIELLEDLESDGSELAEMAHEASVVRLVNEILVEAIDRRASDVHIESRSDRIVIRYRIDGILQSQPVPPEISRFQAAIISRLKIMAHLNIAEKRLPQDGRIKLKVSGREVDIRVSVIPMIHGEGIVMRILDKASMVFELQKLGMGDHVYQVFEELIRLPHGILLVTGPTGSGKTTTLYSSLLQIKSDTTKIITTEDPVEYQLDGINQIQVHSRIGLTFANSLRSILRHDPDVVLVGEIRDLETAENAIQASLTGHLVFSTLHTNDAAGAFTRMVDMGVEPFLVASTVEAVMAQRLVRSVCTQCREAYHPARDELPRDFPWEELDAAGGTLWHGPGCRECRGLGYRGRTGIYELLVATPAVRQLAHDRASSWDIKQAATQAGMLTLRQDGWRRAIAGDTSVEEVLRVTKGDLSLAGDD